MVQGETLGPGTVVVACFFHWLICDRDIIFFQNAGQGLSYTFLLRIYKPTLSTKFLAPTVRGVILVKLAERLTPEEKNT